MAAAIDKSKRDGESIARRMTSYSALHIRVRWRDSREFFCMIPTEGRQIDSESKKPRNGSQELNFLLPGFLLHRRGFLPVNHRAAWFRLAERRVSMTTAVLNERPNSSGSPEKAVAASVHVHEISGWRRVLLWPFGLLVRLWGMSLRFETSPEDLRAYTKTDEPVAMVLWHNRLFLSAEIVRRFRGGRPAYALVSASQDGAWLTAFFSLAGLRTVRGSSSRLGREAASALVETLRLGHDIGVTPDGPRGPCYEVKPGAVIVARRTRAPMLLIGGEFTAAWRLRSWDGFFLPKPFSRVRMRCEVVTADQLADRDAGIAMLRERLLALNPDRGRGGQ
jgi:lysophospholipid acyltransferase (LPLAT)-like uncharacterized protein